ncbi:MAG TPA: Ig-like domain-containing protein, partial [Polyangiales bacterium]
MNTTLFRLLCLMLLGAGALAGCDRANDAPRLHVVAHGPSGTTDEGKAPLRIAFDRPVVAPGEVGRALKQLPLAITPKTALSAHWVDRQTLVATPVGKWAPGTRYEVKLGSPLAERLEESFGFSFEHDPLDVLGTAGVDRRWVETQPHFKLRFDQKVKARDVVERCKLVGKDPQLALALAAEDAGRVDTEIALSVRSALTQGESYTLRCEKLTPALGNAPLQKPFEALFEVYPKLGLVSSTPQAGGTVTPDDLTLSLSFSTPVERAELRKHVRLKPAHPALKREWLARTDTVNELTASFEADTAYTLEIDAGLTDRFGQKLGKAHKIQFRTTNAAPSLSMTSGMFAVEADAPGYPIWTRNVEAFQVECAHVPKAQIAKVLTANIDFDLWYDGNHRNALDFKALGLKPKLGDVSTGNKKNKWVKTPLAFASQCGGPGRGVYLAELRAPAVEARRKQNGGQYPWRVLGNVTNL